MFKFPPCDPATTFVPFFTTQHDNNSSSMLSLCPSTFIAFKSRHANVPSPEVATNAFRSLVVSWYNSETKSTNISSFLNECAHRSSLTSQIFITPSSHPVAMIFASSKTVSLVIASSCASANLPIACSVVESISITEQSPDPVANTSPFLMCESARTDSECA